MKYDTLFEAIKVSVSIRRPLLISGPPGIGKTQVVQQVADDLGIGCIVVHMPVMLVEDFGIPDISSAKENGHLTYTTPWWWPDVERHGERGILLFDDRNQADHSLQKVLANIIEARILHGKKLPDGWAVISTGNRREDRAGAVRVLSHLANRETELTLDVDVPQWQAWAMSKGIDHRLVGFFGFRPHLLCDFDPDRDRNPTPRAWEAVGRMMENIGHDSPIFFDLVAGTVGEGAATELLAFVSLHEELPDVSRIVKGEDVVVDTSKMSVMYAATSAIAAMTETEDHMSNCFKWLKATGRKEFEIVYARLVTSANSKLAATGAFTHWVVENNEAFK